jgi:N-acetylglutamate synthase-like GNAT family acetyltransferase
MKERLPLRRAGLADAARVRELSRAAYAKWVPLIGREPMPMTADLVTEHLIDLLEEAGEFLALIEMIEMRDHLLIENIAVRPDQQGKGFGEGLLRHAESVARSLGFAEVQLYTNAAFASNVAFYAKRGFQEYRRGTMVPGSTTVFMRKQLQNNE